MNVDTLFQVRMTSDTVRSGRHENVQWSYQN